MASDRSVITLQVGHYSNHIGAHFWNIQESLAYDKRRQQELNHDVLFREGQTPNTHDVTYLPRLVVVDLKGSLGLLPEFGDIYNDELTPAASSSTTKSQLATSVDSLWPGSFDVQREESRRKNDFLVGLEQEEISYRKSVILDEDKDICEGQSSPKKSVSLSGEEVNVWSDYLRMRFHPKTNLILKEYQHQNSARPFDIFGLGTEEAKSTQDEYEDRIRYFAEECDYLQGFQMLLDANSAFGGYGSDMLKYLSDDYSAKTRSVFPTIPYSFLDPIRNMEQFLNISLTLRSLITEASLITPMSVAVDTFPLKNAVRSFSGVGYRPELPYHTAAILASSLDCLTLPWRLRSSTERHSMFDVVSGLSSQGRKFATAAVALPFPPMNRSGDLLSMAQLLDKTHPDDTLGLVSITPTVDFIKNDVWTSAVSVRGLENRLKPSGYDLNDPHWQKEYTRNVYLRCDSVNAALLCHFSQHWPESRMAVTSASNAQPIGVPYPQILDQGRSNDTSLMTAWSSSRGSGTMLSKMAECLGKMKLSKLHRFTESGLESDDLLEVQEDLLTQVVNYEPQQNMY